MSESDLESGGELRGKLTLHLQRAASLSSWAMLLVAVIVMEGARPERQTFLDTRWDKDVRLEWDLPRAKLGLLILLVNIAICAVGLILNNLRRRSYGDPVSRSLVIASILSFLGVIMHLILV